MGTPAPSDAAASAGLPGSSASPSGADGDAAMDNTTEGLSRESICDRVAELRADLFGDRGKSRMARELGIRPSTYDRYERDRVPPADLLVKIAEVANVTLDWLVTGTGPRRPPQSLDRDGDELSRRFEEAIAFDHALRPVARAFLDWLENRRRRPESTPAQFSLPSDEKQPTQSGGTIVDTSALHRPRESGSATGRTPSSRDGGESPGNASETTPGRPPGPPVRRVVAEDLIPVVGFTSAGPARRWDETLRRTGADRRAAIDAVIETLLAEQPSLRAEAVAAVESEASSEAAILERVPEATVLQIGGSSPAEFVLSTELKSAYPDAVAWRIDGDSMSPRYEHGDLVITSSDEPARVGQACVARQAGQVGVNCKVFHHDGDEIVLIPVNVRVETQRVPARDVLWAYRVLCVVRRS